MKTVIFKEEKNTINVSKLSDIDLIGIQFIDSKKKSFLVKVRSEEYILAEIKNNNYASKITGKSIQELIKNVSEKKEVYCFDDKTELKQWLLT